MTHARSARAILAACILVGSATGCDALGRQGRRSPQEIATAEMLDDGTKAPAKPKWQPGAWSSEARDVEKSVMRESPSANW